MLDSIRVLIKKVAGKYYAKKYKRCIEKNKPLKGKYGSFRFIADSSLDDFKTIKRYNDSMNLKLISRKTKIRFGIVVYTSSMWNVDDLYHLLNNDERFDVSIIIAPFEMPDRDSSNAEYDKCLRYFKDLTYPVIESKELESLCNYDMLFYLTPFRFYDEKVNLYNVNLNTIILHTSYSFMLSGNMEKLDLWMYHWSLRYYTDSEYYKQLVEKSKYYTGNTVYLGFPKMDRFYTAQTVRVSPKKTIIYAPHHSVNYTQFKSSTFADNYRAILELAKKYSDSTFWIYKPHPMLRANSVSAGVFNSVQEYDEYEAEWSNLSNAAVVNSGDYFDTFKGSDAMITDSVSFLAEYQFTQKPLLLVESGKEKYNSFGDEILKILYKCPGDDIDSIEQFIIDVIENKDCMFEIRKRFFDDNLFYRINGETANKRIYDDIIFMLKGRDEK